MVAALIMSAVVAVDFENIVVADNTWDGWTFALGSANNHLNDYGGSNHWSGPGATAFPWVSGTIPVSGAGRYQFALRWRYWNQNTAAASWRIKIDGSTVASGVVNMKNAPASNFIAGGQNFQSLGGLVAVEQGESVSFELDDPDGSYASFDALWFGREVDVSSGTGTTGTFGPHVSGYIWEAPHVDPALYAAPIGLTHTPNSILSAYSIMAQGTDTQWVQLMIRARGVDSETGGVRDENLPLVTQHYTIEVGRNGAIEVAAAYGFGSGVPLHVSALEYLLAQPDADWLQSLPPNVDAEFEVAHIRRFVRLLVSSMKYNDIDWAAEIPRSPSGELDGGGGFGGPSGLVDSDLDGTADFADFPDPSYELDDLADEIGGIETSVMGDIGNLGFDPENLGVQDKVFSVPIPVPGMSIGNTTFGMSTFLDNAQTNTGVDLDVIRIFLRGFFVVMLSFTKISKVIRTFRQW